ncbi:hypothetical protein FHW89_000056 [Mucilaginibacter sp. SG564]|nr:hypothetical protein [Mucilaginibacter sp. SG564]
MLSSVEAWWASLCARPFDKLRVTGPLFRVIRHLVPESTHPVYASLDHPLFASGGKRVEKKLTATLFPAKLKRGSTSVAMSG